MPHKKKFKKNGRVYNKTCSTLSRLCICVYLWLQIQSLVDVVIVLVWCVYVRPAQ